MHLSRLQVYLQRASRASDTTDLDQRAGPYTVPDLACSRAARGWRRERRDGGRRKIPSGPAEPSRAVPLLLPPSRRARQCAETRRTGGIMRRRRLRAALLVAVVISSAALLVVIGGGDEDLETLTRERREVRDVLPDSGLERAPKKTPWTRTTQESSGGAQPTVLPTLTLSSTTATDNHTTKQRLQLAEPELSSVSTSKPQPTVARLKPVGSTQDARSISPLSGCRCRRRLPPGARLVASSCGGFASRRGPHQRVVSFSWFGGVDTAYFRGIAANAALLPRFYPGWVMRVYYRDPERRLLPWLCPLVCRWVQRPREEAAALAVSSGLQVGTETPRGGCCPGCVLWPAGGYRDPERRLLPWLCPLACRWVQRSREEAAALALSSGLQVGT